MKRRRKKCRSIVIVALLAMLIVGVVSIPFGKVQATEIGDTSQGEQTETMIPEYKTMEQVGQGTTGDVTWTVYDSNADGDGATVVGDIMVFSGTGAMENYSIASESPWYADYNTTITTMIVEEGVTSVGRCSFSGYKSIQTVYIAGTVTQIYDYAFSNCTALSNVIIGDGNGQMNIGSYAFNSCDALTKVAMGNAVASIGYQSFSNCKALCDVTLSENLISIGDRAFINDSGMIEIEIPNSVESIGANAFNTCTSLNSVKLESGLLSIGSTAFNNTAITSISIPDSVTSLGAGAFQSCTSLESVKLPSGLTSISSSLFNNCTKLSNIEIPESVVTIDASAFYSCSALKEVILPERLSTLGNNAFQNCYGLTTLIIPEGVTDLPSGVFRYCTALTEIQLPENLETIGSYAFSGCKALPSIEIPADVTSINFYAFQTCTGLSSVEFLGEKITLLNSGAFYGCSSLVTFEIPASLTTLKSETFQNCTSLTTIEVPDTVTSIEGNVFRNCSNLESVKLSSNITKISSSLFYGCTKLETVEIPYGVTSVENSVFYECKSLTSIVFPDTVSTLGSKMFYNCWNLTSVEIPEGVEIIPAQMFMSCTSLAEVDLPEGLTTINKQAFCGCKSILSIALPDSVTSIDEGAFDGCSGLKTIEIPSGLTAISKDTFNICTSLTEVEFRGESVSRIDEGAFYGCSNLLELDIPKGVTTIGKETFHSCTSLSEVVLPDTLTSIGASAFLGCTQLAEIEIPGTCTKIGDSAFENCISMWKVKMYKGTTTLGARAFRNCKSLWSVQLPEGLETIGDTCFQSCDALETIVIPESVTSLGALAFQSCALLTQVTILADITTIPNYCFNSCIALETLVIPEGVNSIGSYALAACNNLKAIYIPESVVTIYNTSLNGGPSDRKLYFQDSALYEANINMTGATAPFTISYVKQDETGTDVTKTIANVYADGKQSYTFDSDDLPATTGVWMDTSYGDGESVTAAAGFTVRNISDSIQLTEVGSVTVTSQPQDVEMTYGDSGKELSVGVTVLEENVTATYQWQKAAVVDGAIGAFGNIESATADNYSIPTDTAPGEYYYRCVVTCGDTIIYSNQAKVVVNKKQATVTDLAITGWSYGETANVPSYVYDTDEDATVTVEYKLQSAKDTAYSTTVPTDAGTYVVRVCCGETDTYKAAEATAEFSIDRIIVTPSVSGTAEKAYDGTMLVDDGDLSVSLSGVLETETDGVTVSANYTYMSTSAGNDITVVVSGIKLGGDLAKNYALSTTKLTTTGTILAKDLTTDMVSAIDTCYFTNSACTPEIMVKDEGVLLLENRDYTYTYSDNIDVGSANVHIVGCGNYSDKEIIVNFDIQNIATPEYMFRGTKHESGWYKSDVGVYAEGYTVSDSLDDGYAPTHTVATEGSNQYTLYFKQNDTGYITAAEVIEIKIDWTEPTFDDGYGITIGADSWNELKTDISYERGYNEDPVQGAITAYDEFNHITYYYYIDTTGEVFTEEELDALREEGAFTEAVSGAFTLTGENQYVVYAYAEDAVDNRSAYICSDGMIIDTTKPVVSDIVAPSKEALTLRDCTADITFTGSESGTYYYMVKTSDETAPVSIDEFATEQEGVWTALDGVATSELSGDDTNIIKLKELIANTSYVVYIMAIDEFGNISEEVTSVSFTTTKTMPQFDETPTITGVYGDKVEDMTLSQPTSTTAGVTGTWTITDENKSDVPVVGTQQAYEVTFTPTGASAEQYESVIAKVVPNIEKADTAPNLPKTEISVSCGTESAGEVTLPTDWTWKDATIALKQEVPVDVVAVYDGSDKGNYKTESITVTVTREACSTDNTELKNDKEATCKEDGYTGDVCCEECGAVLTEGMVIPKHNNHTWNEGVVTTEPTATESGVKTYTCGVCETEKYDELPEIGAPVISNIVEPSKENSTLADSSAKITFTGNEAGTYYYIVKESGEVVPSSITEFAVEEDGVWTALEGVGEAALLADDTNCIEVSGLNAVTSYVVYIIAIDEVGNISEEVTNVSFTTTKTMPQFDESPTITGVYGDKVEEMTLSKPLSITVGVTGEWTITDEDKGDVPVVGAQKAYEVTFTPSEESMTQFESVTVQVVPVVEKAEVAPNLPDTTVNVPYRTASVGDVTLPADWVWKDAKAPLEAEVPYQAVAVYNGSDKGNYKTESITITITRAACKHGTVEKKNVKTETCKEDGYTGDDCCTVCGAVVTAGKVIPKHTNHTWDAGVVTKESTATEPGEKTYTCNVCGTTKSEEIATLGIPASGTELSDSDGKAIYKVTVSDSTGACVEYMASINKNATTITIPDTITLNGVTYQVTSIAKNAFKNNKKLKKITIGNNIKTIGDNAFYGCTKLKTVKMGKNVTTIGNKAFYNCKKLTSFTIPSKVNKIGKQAFYKCSKLEKITIKSTKLTKKNVKSKAFGKIHSKVVIKVPKSKLKAYKSLLKARGVGSKAKIKK